MTEDFDSLLQDIENGTCALILGPEFHLTGSAENEMITSLRDYLFQKENLSDKSYITEDGFFYITANGSARIREKRSIVNTIRDYYKGFASPELPDFYLSIARLPFYLIISLSPDEILVKAFEEIKKPFDYQYLSNGKNIELEEYPSKEKPLILNLLGSVEDWESMVFTFDSLFDFLYSVFPLEIFSQKFKTSINQASSFLFLGFKYDKWYLKIIFFLLKKLVSLKDIERTAIFSHNESFSRIKDFYEKEFLIYFDNQNVNEFISNLYEKAAKNNLIFVTPVDPVKETSADVFKILFITSVPDDKISISSDIELREMQKILKASGYQDKFLIHPVVAAIQDDIITEISRILPDFVVVSAHGNKNNDLIFRTDDGQESYLNMEEFSKQIEVLTRRNPRNRLKYIMLSCCHSMKTAAALSQFVNCSIGMDGAIPVDAAIRFSRGFFEEFFNGKSFDADGFKFAVELGKLFINSDKEVKKYWEYPVCFLKPN